MALDQQAITLNDCIKKNNPAVYRMLSEKGKAIFFPKKGILSQTAEAQTCTLNATIGSAFQENGEIMHLPSLARLTTLQPKEVFSYAPGPGKPELRKKWKTMLFSKNPSLAGASLSLPMVTVALTHGLYLSGYLFVDQADELILPDLYWENYSLIFNNGFNGKFSLYDTFTKTGGFNTEGLKRSLEKRDPGKKIVILNFPNNPSGYTPTIEEARKIADILIASAESGNEIIAIIDDAYFGLVFEPGIFPESLFSLLANAHERLLAIKLDGPTKEDYVWGFRVGFMTFGIKNGSDDLYAALESKLSGAIRGTISNASHISQSFFLEAYKSATYDSEKTECFTTLKNRYLHIRKILKAHPEFSEVFDILPFNSGYFMCIRINKAINAEQVRQLLITQYSTGVIVFDDLIRIAFSSTPVHQLETLYRNIYEAGKKLLGTSAA
jgi:aspartate/methionine/tyrosine aminotransferase